MAAGLALVASALTATAAPAPAGNDGVGTRLETFVDTSRTTPANPQGTDGERPERTLPTTIYFPTDADGATKRGRFPLVLFSHGTATDATTYDGLLRTWARAGFVVAAPAYPRTSRQARGGPDLTNQDRDQQPADASFVITGTLALPWLDGTVDADRVFAAGHSLGAYTSLQLGYGACCHDDRIDGVVSLAGLGYGRGGVADDPTPPPLLVVHAEDDPEVPYRYADATMCAATTERWLVSLDGVPGVGAHLTPFTGGDTPAARLATDATTAFLRAVARGKDPQPTLRRAVRADPGVGTLHREDDGDPC